MPSSEAISNAKGRKLPRLIFLTGVDGSGKTFFTERLIEELKKRGLPVRHLWSRFNNIFSKPLLAFCRLIGINYYVTKNGVRIGYHDFEKSRLISWCFIICQLIDLWIVTLIKVWPPIIAGKILVCDRGAYDTLIDVMVDTKNRSLCTSKFGTAFLMLLPRNHRVFYLRREPELIYRSRPDVSLDKNFALRWELYQTCAVNFGWLSIDNNNTIEETMHCILSYINNL